MADVTSVAIGATTVGANYEKFSINTSDAGKEYILSITADAGTLTNAKLKEVYNYLTTNNYTPANTDGSSAGTWAGLGTADGTPLDFTADTVALIRFQTTQDFDVTDFNAASTLTTLAIVAVFRPAK
jgi:hypothetical protein